MKATVPLRVSVGSPVGAALLCLLFATAAEATVWYVPGVANADGRNGTHFSSDVRILNRGSAAVLASFELVPTGGDPPPPVTRAVAAGETFVAPNVLEALWGLSGAGTLKVTVDQSVAIAARTYNDADPSGTYGTALTPVRHEDLLEAGDTGHAAWVSESVGPSSASSPGRPRAGSPWSTTSRGMASRSPRSCRPSSRRGPS